MSNTKMRKKVKLGVDLAPEMVAQFNEWADAIGAKRGVHAAAALRVWMRLDPALRERILAGDTPELVSIEADARTRDRYLAALEQSTESVQQASRRQQRPARGAS